MKTSYPLRGIRVVDFCWVLAGPFGTRILANFGAEVIKIETRTRGDRHRKNMRPDGAPGENVNRLFNDANTGKLSFTVDLKHGEGLDLVKRLIADSDVVTNNFRPGAMDRMGLGYDVLRGINPEIVLINMPGCGNEGPWAHVRTMGNLLMAASGLNAHTGFPDRPPSGMGVAYPDFTSPYLLSTTVLAAIRERDRTGVGQELNLSQLSATISLLGAEWMQFARTGQAPPRNQNRDPNYCPHGVYTAAGDDNWCAIAVDGDAEWAHLCRTIERPELADDPRFATHAARKSNEDEIDRVVSAWTQNLDRWRIADLLQDGGIAAAAVEDLQDTLVMDPHMSEHYQHVQQPSDPDLDITIDREAIRFRREDRVIARAPMVGEHNDYVLKELLGIPDGEIGRLTANGVIN